MANVLFFAAWFHQHRREWQIVQARVEEGMALATEHGFSRWLTQATFLQGRLLFERGQNEAGIAQMVEGRTSERGGIGLARWNALFAALLAEAYGKSGQTNEGLKIVNEELANARVTECCCYQAELHRIKGELLLGKAAEDEQQAEACLANALTIARSQSAKSLELRAAMSVSRLRQRQGKFQEARYLLNEIYGWFTEGFDTADLKQAKALLNELQ
jgi:predicted ATPase